MTWLGIGTLLTLAALVWQLAGLARRAFGELAMVAALSCAVVCLVTAAAPMVDHRRPIIDGSLLTVHHGEVSALGSQQEAQASEQESKGDRIVEAKLER